MSAKIRTTQAPPGIGRRRFLKRSAAVGAAILWLPSCADSESGGAQDASGPVIDADPNQPDGLFPTCGELTANNIEGPFFATDSPLRSDLTENGMPGIRLRVSGQVLSTDCSPLAGATLDFWQANDMGDYDNAGFTLRGHQITDVDGRYQLDTIIPGRYLNGASFRPAHLHVKVSAAGHPVLTTQLYFEGDPFNDSDAFIVESLIMELNAAQDREESSFDFVLA
tara:strand:- start:3702 stop:4373 length:672 start_codon:yes stop_codon:yes gene_type:complete